MNTHTLPPECFEESNISKGPPERRKKLNMPPFYLVEGMLADCFKMMKMPYKQEKLGENDLVIVMMIMAMMMLVMVVRGE